LKTAETFMQGRLNERIGKSNYRMLRPETKQIDFCSNDYLGFARSAELKKAIKRECSANRALNGATGSRLISGNLRYTEAVEQQIAQWLDNEASLLFNSGYDANVGLLSSLPQRGDTIICDELIHASAIDGARLSHANRYTFTHNDVDSLESKLQNAKGVCYVVVESVYSMDGDSPPLLQIVETVEKYNAHLIVDEAHAVGLYKKGLVNELNLQHRVFARVITFGKALGCHGAAVVGSVILRNYLINFARSFIYTTAAPFHQVAAIKTAIELLSKSDDVIENLKQNISLFKTSLSPAVLEAMPPSTSAIQCIVLSSALKAATMAAVLQNKRFDVRAILSPTVAEGSERLRICLHAYNTEAQISMLTEIINPLI
jgi:8-amino-7-oxononanoate synthase